MKNFLLCLTIFFTLTVSAQPQQQRGQITVDGINRTFVTYIPSLINNQGKVPVIISLHGRLSTGEAMMRFADFRPIAEREKFIIVCPDGIDKSWNDGRPTPANKKGINHVKFIDQLITYIINTYHGDDTRVYIAGMSNGGFMASRLACELNKRIAAVAVVAASMARDVSYQPKLPMPVMYIQGTADPLVPFEGGAMKGAGGEIYSHQEILQNWVKADSCSSTPVTAGLPDIAHDGTTIIKEEYSPRAGAGLVIGYNVINGGHCWPGAGQYLPKFLIGRASGNLNACQVIWDFFKSFRRENAVISNMRINNPR